MRLLRSGIVLALLVVNPSVGHAQTPVPAVDIGGFLACLVGDWVGTVEETTDGKNTASKFFHAVVVEQSPGTYETTFDYYTLDPATGKPVAAGGSTMTTKVASDGTAKNNITGKGQVKVAEKTSKPEQHDLCETLCTCVSGGLQGTGSGSIQVSGMPLGLGKNGKVKDFSSTWSMCGGVLKISQRFKVGFKVLMFEKNSTFAADFTASRGSDVAGLMANRDAAATR